MLIFFLAPGLMKYLLEEIGHNVHNKEDSAVVLEEHLELLHI